MASALNKKQNFVTREVEAAKALIEALNNWNDLQTEWFAQNYGVEIIDADLQGDNEHLVAANLSAGFTTYGELKSLMEAGHWTNLYTLVS